MHCFGIITFSEIKTLFLLIVKKQSKILFLFVWPIELSIVWLLETFKWKLKWRLKSRFSKIGRAPAFSWTLQANLWNWPLFGILIFPNCFGACLWFAVPGELSDASPPRSLGFYGPT